MKSQNTKFTTSLFAAAALLSLTWAAESKAQSIYDPFGRRHEWPSNRASVQVEKNDVQFRAEFTTDLKDDSRQHSAAPVEIFYKVPAAEKNRRILVTFKTACVTEKGVETSSSSNRIESTLPAGETDFSSILQYDWVFTRTTASNGDPATCKHSTSVESLEDSTLKASFQVKLQ